MKSQINSILDFFRDYEYYRQLMRLAVPIALQNLITSSLNMVALIFIGQLGEESVAAVGLGNQIWFLLNLMVFGICSGSAMFVAQLWGKRDIPNIRKVLGLTIKLSLIPALFFWIVAVFFPSFALGIYTKDAQVILIGSKFLSIYGWSYLFFAMTAVFSTAARSTGNVRLPLIVSTSALGLNVLLAYPFIFGFQAIGLPAMGVQGAAVAGLIARILECLAILISVYHDRMTPIAASIKDIVELNVKFMVAVMKPVLPVILNEVLWSLGITTYTIIYGHIGTIAVASINIISTIEQMAFVVFLGLGTATSIMVGNQIGQGNRDKAYLYGGRSLLIQGTGALIMGGIVYLVAGNIFQFYKVDPEVIANAKIILTIFSCGLWMKASNHVIIIGILRSGGDTKFSLVLDGLVIWFIGVPITAAGAFLLGLPVYFVYALTFTEEAVKLIVGVKRYFSKKWINDLTQKVENISLAV
ncbi:MAG: MATE family efflux transporter [Chloroflexi bacterium HGW-Chloroflexi-5]|nr:MAG: MATE family efflux transporter [Chloroflexi bacterium HGW-Chloroflexi-5]